MNARYRRQKRYRSRIRRATLMAESGYVPTREHLQRALVTPLLCDGREIAIGSVGDRYRYFRHVDHGDREAVLHPPTQSAGVFLRVKKEDRR